MVAFQEGTIHDVAVKVGDYNKTGGVPRPSLNIWCNWVNRYPQQICEGKG